MTEKTTYQLRIETDELERWKAKADAAGEPLAAMVKRLVTADGGAQPTTDLTGKSITVPCSMEESTRWHLAAAKDGDTLANIFRRILEEMERRQEEGEVNIIDAMVSGVSATQPVPEVDIEAIVEARVKERLAAIGKTALPEKPANHQRPSTDMATAGIITQPLGNWRKNAQKTKSITDGPLYNKLGIVHPGG